MKLFSGVNKRGCGLNWAGALLAGVLLAAAVPAHSLPAVDAAVAIPPLHGNVLAGQHADLPEAFRGRAGVLVIGFSQASREQVSAWGHRLADDYYSSANVPYFEMAMLAEVPKLLRGLVTRKIKEEVSPRGQEHFLMIPDHEPEWKAAAAYHAPDDAYVLLINGNGEVVWRTGGALSEAGYAELTRRLKALSQ